MSSYQSPSVLPKGAARSNGVGGAPALRALQDNDDDSQVVPGPSSQISAHGDREESISIVEARSGHTDIVSNEGGTTPVVVVTHVDGEEEVVDGDGEAEGSDEAPTAANTIIQEVTTTDQPEEVHDPPPDNNNQADNQGTMILVRPRGGRHRRRRPRHRMVHPEQDQLIVQAQPPPPPAIPQAPPPIPQGPLAIPQIAVDQNDFLADNDELRIFKTILDYETLPLCKGSLALMAVGWILLVLPTHADHPIPSALSVTACLLLACLAVGMLTLKSDLRIRGPFRTFELRSFELVCLAGLTYLMEFTWSIVFMSHKDFLPLHPYNNSQLQSEVVQIRALPMYDFFYPNYYLTFRLNSQFFLIGFSILLLVTSPMTLCRMAHRNHQIREILVKE